jgi:hypothetical protein
LACTHKHPAHQPLQVILPNSAIISSTHTAKLPFPQLPTKAIEAHIFPHLRNHALLSIGVLCDSGCTVTFTKGNVQVRYNNRIVLEGTRIPPGLWSIDILAPQQANATYSAPLKAAALQHIHASFFSPATQTWIKAVKNQHFNTWPPFTPQEIAKLLPKSIATTLGHLDQQRKNVRSTKRKPRTTDREDTDGIEDTNPCLSISPNHPTNPTLISLDVSPSIQIKAISTSWYFICTTPTRSSSNHLKTAAKENKSRHTKTHYRESQQSTNQKTMGWTMRPQHPSSNC